MMKIEIKIQGQVGEGKTLVANKMIESLKNYGIVSDALICSTIVDHTPVETHIIDFERDKKKLI